MEWQGINLNDSRKKRWMSDVRLSLKKLEFALLLMSLMSLSLTFYNLQKNDEIPPLEAQLLQLNQDIASLEQRLAVLNNHRETPLAFANADYLNNFIKLIHELPLKNGGITAIQLYLDNGLYLKLSGKLNSHTDFQTLENYLKHQTFTELKTDHVTVNDKNETDFIFTLKYKGRQ